MSTRASIYRHPVHPMLIVLPLGLWVFSVICYLIYLLSSVSVWHTVALYATGGGLIGGILAAFIITFALATFGNEQSVVPFVLSLFGLLAVGTGGWLGGALVYEHGIRGDAPVDVPGEAAQIPLEEVVLLQTLIAP